MLHRKLMANFQPLAFVGLFHVTLIVKGFIKKTTSKCFDPKNCLLSSGNNYNPEHLYTPFKV